MIHSLTMGRRLGAITLIRTHIVRANTTSITFSGLNGNADFVYLLTHRIRNKSGTNTYYDLRPNGATTNFRTQITYTTAGSTTGNLHTDALHLSFAIVDATFAQGLALIYAAKNSNNIAEPLTYTGHWSHDDGTNFYTGQVAGRWNETATNVTSLDVVASVANGIGDGSVISLYKLAA